MTHDRTLERLTINNEAYRVYFSERTPKAGREALLRRAEKLFVGKVVAVEGVLSGRGGFARKSDGEPFEANPDERFLVSHVVTIEETSFVGISGMTVGDDKPTLISAHIGPNGVAPADLILLQDPEN